MSGALEPLNGLSVTLLLGLKFCGSQEDTLCLYLIVKMLYSTKIHYKANYEWFEGITCNVCSSFMWIKNRLYL